jgi:hypothetical protein
MVGILKDLREPRKVYLPKEQAQEKKANNPSDRIPNPFLPYR